MRRQSRSSTSWIRTVLPPTGITDPSGVHLAHVAHADDTNSSIIHLNSMIIRTHCVDPIDHGFVDSKWVVSEWKRGVKRMTECAYPRV